MVVRTVAAGATPIVAPAGLFISPPTVAADPISTTALVLTVVDGDTIDSAAALAELQGK